MSAESAEFLLINHNNTRTKFALADRGGVLAKQSILSSEVEESFVRDTLTGWDWDKVVLASVVPDRVPALIEAQDGREVVEISYRAKLGIEIDFPHPEMIGADRLANAVAVADEYPGESVIVVDFGTAVTFDIIDARPAYLGGVIAPGLDAMKHYLHQRTALLPEIELERPESAIGKSTVAAMQVGAFHGYRGLVREILAQIQSELEVRAKVIATGGYAALIGENFAEIESIDSQLTMRGLLKAALLNF